MGGKSAFRNAASRREHKERSQPAHRRRLGLLEKHKDYVLRARDFHKKDRVIKKLRHRAEQRNPDEFYYAMTNKQTKQGIHEQRGEVANKYSKEELQLMRTQDEAYLTMKAQQEAKKIEKMKSSLHIIDAANQIKRNHILFVDSADDLQEYQQQGFRPQPAKNTSRERKRKRNAIQKAIRQQENGDGESRSNQVPAIDEIGPIKLEPLPGKMLKSQAAAYKELQQRQSRQNRLQQLAKKMHLQKQLAGKGSKQKIRQGNSVTFKWKPKRLK